MLKFRWSRLIMGGLLLSALAPWASAPARAGALRVPGRCFDQTAHCIEEMFQAYWDSHGGLPIFGYPLAPGFAEHNADTNQAHPTQWFERNRLELHPEHAPPYNILLGRLGAEHLRQRG